MTIAYCRAPDCVGVGGLPNLTAAWICATCDARTRGVVQDAAFLYLAMREQMVPGGNHRPGAPTAQATDGHPPVSLVMLAMGEETTLLFVRWAAFAAGRDAVTKKTASIEAFGLALAELDARHPQLMASAHAPAYAGALADWSRRARTLTGYELPAQRLSRPCPVCDLRGLRWYPSQGVLMCVGCRTQGPALLRDELAAAAQSHS